MWVYLFFLIIGSTISLLVVLKIERLLRHKAFTLTPFLVLVVAFFLYSISLPISRIFFRSTNIKSDDEFILLNSLAFLGVIIGLYLFYKIKDFKPTAYNYKKDLVENTNTLIIFLVISLLFAFQLYKIFRNLDWNFAAFFMPYGYEAQLGNGKEMSSAESTIEIVLIAAVNVGFSLAQKNKKKVLKFFTCLIGILFAVIMLIRGSRNIAGMMMAPIAYSFFLGKEFSIRKLVLGILLIYFSVYAIGVVRSVGFAKISNIEYSYQMFDPNTQEFGTGASVFSTWYESRDRQHSYFGYTYFITPFVNLIPINLWPERPQGPAIQMSMDYYGVKNVIDLPYGLGFSPLVEAVMNFGYIGIMPVFFLFTIILCRYYLYLYRQYNAWSLACAGFLIPIVLNWNRIDFATCFKIYMIFHVSAYLFSLLYTRRIRI
ncbi:MAG: hypothetical protein JWN76_2005 [Chitinophagaceae bacterium]|nr:hypothetical protein [Chitinophagaceae bacterium]